MRVASGAVANSACGMASDCFTISFTTAASSPRPEMAVGIFMPYCTNFMSAPRICGTKFTLVLYCCANASSLVLWPWLEWLVNYFRAWHIEAILLILNCLVSNFLGVHGRVRRHGLQDTKCINVGSERGTWLIWIVLRLRRIRRAQWRSNHSNLHNSTGLTWI